MDIQITARQAEILRALVEAYVATGEPVGSKTLVEIGAFDVSSSTVRSELAELESRGLLTHPHTSAGRVPTEHGYRIYAGELLERLEPRTGAAITLELPPVRSEIEEALQRTTETLAQVTKLLALVSAPPLESTVVRHVEVLVLQPRVVVVVVITSTGGVTKRVVTFDGPVDPGLAAWAKDYLNERVAGMQLGAMLLRQRLEAPELSPAERSFLAAIAPAFTDLVRAQEQRVYVGGAAGLLGEARGPELAACHRLLELLERRAELLRVIGEAVEPRRAVVRVGGELDHPDLQEIAFVGAAYGLANRPLGSVGLLGPVRMDYGRAIRTVRAAAAELSRFVEDVYEGD